MIKSVHDTYTLHGQEINMPACVKSELIAICKTEGGLLHTEVNYLFRVLSLS